MCVTPAVNKSVYDTLYNNGDPSDWLDHYDSESCRTQVSYYAPLLHLGQKNRLTLAVSQSIIPTMEFVPRAVDGKHTYANGDKIELKDIIIDPTNYFRPSRQNPTVRDELAGVYTLYPYIDIPDQIPLAQIDDPTVQQNYENLLSLQLKYYTDVDYHIKVEVTGLSKVKVSTA